MEYLKHTTQYWNKGYEAENVESWVFRTYGRILKPEFGMDGSKGEKVLDFGCGQGAALNFFKGKGFNVYGVDISAVDLDAAKRKMPDIEDHFLEIASKPQESDMYFGGNFDLIVSVQTLYYYNDTDLKIRLQSLSNMLKPGGFVYFTMVSKTSWVFNHATPVGEGLYRLELKVPRFALSNYYLSFVEDEEDMKKKFSLFEPIHLGFYAKKTRNDEGAEHHLTFFGRKPLSS